MRNLQYLFCAEARQIQKTILSASLQRQVVGGSQSLSIISELAANQTEVGENQVIVNKGGTFRIIFDDSQKAREFGDLLATTYQSLLNGVMTIAEPIEFEDRGKQNCFAHDKQCAKNEVTLCYTCANEQLDLEMKRLKQQQPFSTTQPHAPIIALCKHSGIYLAEELDDDIPGLPNPEGNKSYFSGAALRMRDIGYLEKKKGTNVLSKSEQEGFLKEIRMAIPDEIYHTWAWAADPETLAEWDSERRNIAYLVADGNNMGTYFGKCRTPQQSKDLSEALTQYVYKAIAQPIPELIDNLNIGDEGDLRLPLLPLIAAGDDVFVMLPAAYALDYARQFCLTFEEINDTDIIKQLQEENHDLTKVTMSASVVICKQNYPYLLAHNLGEAGLKQTKRIVKWVGHQSRELWYSAVSFNLILGSVGGNGRSPQSNYRPTLSTYWADDKVDARAMQSAIPINYLFKSRVELDKLPAKRRAELRSQFDKPIEKKADWDQDFSRILRRIETTEPQMFPFLKTALRQMAPDGSTETNLTEWKLISRPEDSYHAHGLPDLLAIWAYAQQLEERKGSVKEN